MNIIVSNQKIFVKLLAFYFVCLVLGALNIGAIGSLLKIIAFLPFVWWLLNKHAVKPTVLLVSSILFLGFSTISIVWSINPENTLVGIIGTVSLMLLLCSVSGYRYTEEDIDFLKKALVWSSRITALVVLIAGGNYESRLTLGGILNEDPNYICAYYLFGIAHAVEQIISDKKYTHKLFCILELSLYVGLIISTGSRGGALAAVSTLVIAGVGCIFQNHFSFKTLILPLFALFAIAIAAIMAPYFLPETVLQRFYFQEIIESQGTGRYQIWKDFLGIFWNSDFWRQLIGFGSSSLSKLAMQNRLITFHVAHNIFIEHLVGLGLIGLFLYVQMLWQYIKTAYRHRNIFAFSVLGGIIVLTFSTSFGGKALFNILIFIVCLTQIKQVK